MAPVSVSIHIATRVRVSDVTPDGTVCEMCQDPVFLFQRRVSCQIRDVGGVLWGGEWHEVDSLIACGACVEAVQNG